MNANVVVAVLIFTGAGVLVITIIAMAAAFRPSLARAVKVAEVTEPRIRQQVHQLRYKHPELVKAERLDRHDAYVWLHLGLWMFGLGVVLATPDTGAITALSWDAQKLLGVCILTGSSVALAGTTLGLRLPGGRFYINRRVTSNLLSDLIGADIRMPYTLGALGLVSVGVSMTSYAWTIYQYSTLVGTLAGGVTFAIGGMCVTLGIKLVRRIFDYVRQRDLLLTEIGIRMDGAEQ